ncbi:MAG: SusC/RagA family TonB-linked outer membrane protein [Breznakibacter sp.]
MKKKLFGFLIMFLVTCMAYAQTAQVTGVVYDNTGATLPGANVIIKGTTNGTITDMDGKFSLSVENVSKQILKVSFIGMTDLEVPLTGKITGLQINLKESSLMVEEVVAVGYGVQRKKDLTGSISTVGEKVLKDVPVSSAAEAITGRLAGVQVTTTEGSPDAEVKIRVRGGGSISQDNSPLFIVDGFPVTSISNIPPSDIQDISVLKDASSTAIYGARGANGVILITTKGGKEGAIKVDVNAYVGLRQKINSLGVLNPYEYVMYQYELDQSTTFQNYYGVYDDLDIYKSVAGTDWQDEVFGRTAMQQYYNVGISGGTKSSTYNLSVTRSDEESIMIGSGFERNNINFKMKSQLSDKFTLDFNTRLSYSITEGAGTSSEQSGSNTKLRNSVKYAPTKGLREFSDGSLADDDINSPEATSLLYNPVESVEDEYKKQYKLSTTFNAAINWKIAKPLTFRSELGYAFQNNRTDNVWGPSTSTAKQYAGQPVGRIYQNEGQDWRIANTLTFLKDNFIPDHNINVLIGQEMSSVSGKSVTNESRYFPTGMSADNVLAMFNLGTPVPTQTYINANVNLNSFFGRINYSFKDRYLLAATFRADGSSKFADGNRWGYFPSVALGWRLSEESFLQSQSEWLYNLKLRASYGSSGNNRIASGLYEQNYSTNDENKPYFPGEKPASQLIPKTVLANKDLKWETTHTANAGIDYGLFKGRVSGTVDLYYNRTVDLLIEQPIPESTGYLTQMKNIGQTSNRGIEFTVDASIIERKDWGIGASFNITFNKNKVDKFVNGNDNFKTYSSGWNGSAAPTSDFKVVQGEELGLMYGYVTDGMYSFDDFTFNSTTRKWDLVQGRPDNSGLTSAGAYFGPGALKFKDQNGDNIVDEKDKVNLGSAQPIHVGGFSLNGHWKGFDASAFFNWSYGNEVYNANKLDYTCQLLSRRYQNLSDEMVLANRFTTIDPATGYNIYQGKNANPELLQQLNAGKTMWMPLHTTTALHSYAIEDGSFLRLNNVTIGYTLPQNLVKKAHLSSARFYFTGYNLALWTNYSGFDPEVDTRRSTPLTPGVDYSAYPRSRQYVFGVNLSF